MMEKRVRFGDPAAKKRLVCGVSELFRECLPSRRFVIDLEWGLSLALLSRNQAVLIFTSRWTGNAIKTATDP